MNYQGFGTPVSEFVNQVDIGGNSNSLNASGFDSAIRGALAEAPYPADLTKWNSLSTHDISRFLTRAGGDHWRLYLGTFLQMTLPGSPVVYYGDEIGMQGAANPYNRHTFDWTQADWDAQARSLTRTLIAARHALPALQSGGMMTLLANNTSGVYAFARMLSDKGGQVIVVVNSSGATAAAFQLPVWYASLADGTSLTDRVSGQTFTVTNGMITISGLLGHYGLVLSP